MKAFIAVPLLLAFVSCKRHVSDTELIISGTVVNCSNAAVTDGYVDVFVGHTSQRTPIKNGAFSVTVLPGSTPPATAVVTAIDVANSGASVPRSFSITSNTVNTGQLSACGDVKTEYINLTMRGIDYLWVPPTDSLYMFSMSNDFIFWGFRLPEGNRSNSVNAGFRMNGTNTVPLTQLQITKNDSMFWATAPITISLSETGPYIAGSFAGTVKHGNGSGATTTIAPINVSFRIRQGN